MGNKQGRSSKAGAEALKRFQSNTGLMSIEAKQLSKVFEACSHGTGHVTRIEFQDALGQLEEFGLAKFRNLPMGQRLFDQFDVNKDDKVDLQEFMTGFLLLCKGSDEDKLELTFRVFDKDGNGMISKDELIDMYTSTYRALIISMRESVTPDEYRENESARQFQDEVLKSIEEKFKRSIEAVTKNIYSKMDTDHDGQLDKEEFREFVLGNPFVKATYEVKLCHNADVTTTAGSVLSAEVLLSFLNDDDSTDQSSAETNVLARSARMVDEKSERSERSDKGERSEKSEKSDKSERSDKSEKSPTAERKLSGKAKPSSGKEKDKKQSP